MVRRISAVAALACLIALPQLSRAQQPASWEPVTGPDGGYVTSLHAAPNGTWWLGAWGGIHASYDSGRSWLARGLTATDIREVAGIGRDTILAATGNGLWMTHDNGEQWTQLYPYNTDHVHVAPDGTIIVAISGGGVSFSRDGGAHFTPASNGLSGIDLEVLSLTVHPSGAVFIGTHSGILHVDAIGGTWQRGAQPASGGYCDALATSPEGMLYAAFLNKPIAVSLDTGKTWNAVRAMPTLGYMTGLFARERGEVLVTVAFGVGCAHGDVPPGGTRPGVFRSLDTGRSWRQVMNGYGAAALGSIEFADAGECLVGSSWGPLVSRDGFASWNAPEAGLQAVLAIGMASDGGDGLFVTGPSGAFRSDNRGRSWRRLGTARDDTEMRRLAIGRDGTMYGANAGDSIWVSMDRGDTWQSRGPILDSTQRPLAVLVLGVDSAGTLYAGTDGQDIAASTDQGLHWTLSAAGYTWCADYCPNPIVMGRHGEVFMIMADGIYRTTDRGATWSIFGAEDDFEVGSILRAHSGTLLCGRMSGQIIRSTDDGRQWIPVRPAMNGGVWDIRDIGGRIYACITGTGVLVSDDDGVTWTDAMNGMPTCFPIGIVATDDGEAFVRTYGSGIFRMPSATAVHAPATHPSEVVLEQNWPNPCAGGTAIPFSLQRGGHVRIEISDVLGRVVAVPVDGERCAGRHVVPWDAGMLPAGQYRCTVTCGAASATRTITLQR